MTIEEIIKQGIQKLEGNPEAAFLARKVLEVELKKDHIYLVTHQTEPVALVVEQQYKQKIEKLSQGTPLQYITHQQNFMGLSFYVDETVLIPQPDTEILVEEVIQIASQKERPDLLDLCTGSGCIAIALAKHITKANILATDISKKALEIAQKNAKQHGVEIEFLVSDLWEKVRGTYDIIVSNPPYIRTDVIPTLDREVQKEPILALNGGKDGLFFYRAIIEKATMFLKEKGMLCLEIGYDQKEQVVALLEENQYQVKKVKKDWGGNDRVVIAQK